MTEQYVIPIGDDGRPSGWPTPATALRAIHPDLPDGYLSAEVLEPLGWALFRPADPPAAPPIYRVESALPTDQDGDGAWIQRWELVERDDLTPEERDALMAEYMAWRRGRAKERVHVMRTAACQRPVEAHGRVWDADARSQELLHGAITMAQAGAPLPPVWRDAANEDMPVTSLEDLTAIAAAMAAQTQAVYAESWAAKAAIDAAETAEAVDAIVAGLAERWGV